MDRNESILAGTILAVGASTAFSILLYRLGCARGFDQGYKCGQSIGFMHGSLTTIEACLKAANNDIANGAAKVAEEATK